MPDRTADVNADISTVVSTDISTDISTDVVVLGTGPAGMAAVSAAAGEGVEVLAVEPMAHIGGNAVWSTGYLTFVGSGMQVERGIADDVDLFVGDARRAVESAAHRFGVLWDEDIVRRFATESAETYRILTERGVRFTRFVPRPGEHTVDRMAAVEDPWMLGRAFQPDFARPTVTTLYGHAGQRLVTTNGRVTGVVVRPADGGEDIAVTARKGVVLATGGYQANPRLRQRYQPEFVARSPYLGIDTCRGDGHLMGQAIGGDLVNMTVVPPLVIVSSAVVEDAIAVNAAGERFHDEAGPYDQRIDRMPAHPGRRAQYILDAVVARERATLIAQMPEPAVTADTLPELAGLIGVPAAALVATVERWNAFLAGAAPVDPDFGRVVLPPGRRPCATGPFTAVPMVEGINFPCGGFSTTTDMQVVDVFGLPIPGLFAAGDCAGGLNILTDLGGVHIAGGFTLGRVAGRAAARGIDERTRRGGVHGAALPSRLDTRAAAAHLQPAT